MGPAALFMQTIAAFKVSKSWSNYNENITFICIGGNHVRLL